jgi:hypothetical protein
MGRDKEKFKAYLKEYYANMNPEQKKRLAEQNRIRMKRYYDNRSEEQKEKDRQYRKQYYANLSEEKKMQYKSNQQGTKQLNKFLNR